MRLKDKIPAFLIVFLCIFACTNNQNFDSLTIEQQISQLHSEEEKKAFLEQIYDDDQKVRGSEDAQILLEFGKDSEEYMAYVKRQLRMDEMNMKKVGAYLDKFGHPEKKILGEKAASAPWIVIHHSADVNIRNKHFKALYSAYLNGDLDDGQMYFYLGRSYEFTFRERLQMERPYTVEDELNQLIKGLNLEIEKEEVLVEMNQM